jgi:hypothetical protein
MRAFGSFQHRFLAIACNMGYRRAKCRLPGSRRKVIRRPYIHG